MATVNTNCIIFSQRGHRIGFLLQDLETQNDPTILIVTPYLHERRVYLTPKQFGKDYFYSAIETQLNHLELYNK